MNRIIAAAGGAFALAISLTGAAKAQDFINVLTGGTSGVYYPLGAGLANIYGEKIEGVRTQVQSTKASVENMNLIQEGRGEIAFALGDTVAAAWAGVEEAGQRDGLREVTDGVEAFVGTESAEEARVVVA